MMSGVQHAEVSENECLVQSSLEEVVGLLLNVEVLHLPVLMVALQLWAAVDLGCLLQQPVELFLSE